MRWRTHFSEAVRDMPKSVLDQPQDVLGAITEVHDVPDVFNFHAAAELGLQLIADALERAAKTGRWRAIAAHADRDRVCHSLSRQGICGQDVGWLIATATPDAARPMPSANRMPPTPVAAAR